MNPFRDKKKSRVTPTKIKQMEPSLHKQLLVANTEKKLMEQAIAFFDKNPIETDNDLAHAESLLRLSKNKGNPIHIALTDKLILHKAYRAYQKARAAFQENGNHDETYKILLDSYNSLNQLVNRDTIYSSLKNLIINALYAHENKTAQQLNKDLYTMRQDFQDNLSRVGTDNTDQFHIEFIELAKKLGLHDSTQFCLENIFRIRAGFAMKNSEAKEMYHFYLTSNSIHFLFWEANALFLNSIDIEDAKKSLKLIKMACESIQLDPKTQSIKNEHIDFLTKELENYITAATQFSDRRYSTIEEAIIQLKNSYAELEKEDKTIVRIGHLKKHIISLFEPIINLFSQQKNHYQALPLLKWVAKRLDTQQDPSALKLKMRFQNQLMSIVAHYLENSNEYKMSLEERQLPTIPMKDHQEFTAAILKLAKYNEQQLQPARAYFLYAIVMTSLHLQITPAQNHAAQSDLIKNKLKILLPIKLHLEKTNNIILFASRSRTPEVSHKPPKYHRRKSF